MSLKLSFPLLLLCVSLIALSSCSKKDPHTGLWSWTITDTPEGTVTGEMAINKDGDNYVGTFIAGGQSSELKNLKIVDNVGSFQTSAGGYFLDVEGTFSAENFLGTVTVEGYEFPMTANKTSDKPAAP